MKKKMRMPKKFGDGITGQIFEANGCCDLYEFFGDLCEEARKKNKSLLKERLKEDRRILDKVDNPELKKELTEHFLYCRHNFSDIYLAIGFSLGQRLDILTPEAQKEIDYVWQRLREEGIFFTYPRKKAA